MSSYFGNTLNRLMLEVDVNQHQLAERIDLYDAQVSRILKGKQTFINPKELEKYLNFFAKDARGNPTPMNQAALVAAHCMDMRIGPGSEFVKISIEMPVSGGVPPRVELSPEAESAMGYIRKAISSQKDMEQFLFTLAKMMGMK